MDAGLLAQYVVIALVVLASLVMVLRSQFPAATRRWRIIIALWLLCEGRSVWMKALGRRIAPTPKAGGKGGCSGCDNCD